MMILKTRQMLTVGGLALALSTVGCSKKDASDDKTTDTTDGTATGGGAGGATKATTVTISGTLGVGAALTAATLSDLKLFCITFEDTPRSGTSEFGDGGAFAVTLPANVNFGCFVNDKATNQTVASFVIAPAADGFGGGATSMSLGASVNLGALILGTDGTVVIPHDVVASSASTAAVGINVDDMHNAEYDMECQDTGNADDLAKCQDDIMDGGKKAATVFFRILKGSEGDHSVIGLGVWESRVAFKACGGFDMSTGDIQHLTNDGIVLNQVDVGTFVANEVACPTGHGADAEVGSVKSLKANYALSELVPNGAGYSFRDGDGGGDKKEGASLDDQQVPGGMNGDGQYCRHDHSTAIEFTGTADVMFGSFTSSENVSGCNSEDSGASVKAFSVKFTKTTR